MVSVTLERNTENAHGGNAVAVIAAAEGKGAYTIGYLPRVLAAFVAPLMDAGKEVKARYKAVTGLFSPLAHRGLIGIEV
jgi:hypothetical protein